MIKICGIVGAIGNILPAGEKAVHQMLIFDTVRGEHSTGLLGVQKFDEESYTLAKQVGNPFELFEMPAYKKIMGGSSRVMIGHNRYATQGKVNKFNAHPFDFDTLVGVHNGSLFNKHALFEGNKWDVDSQALYAHIEAKGVEDALRTARGAFALVWWDKQENVVNFIRNEDRPLFYALTEGASPTMFFASEKWMIEVACMRNSIKIHEVEMFEVGLLYQVPVGKGGVLGKPVIRPVEFSPPQTTVTYFNGKQQQTTGSVNVDVKNGTVVVKEGNASSQEKPQSTSGTGMVGATSNASDIVVINKKSILDPSFMSSKGMLFEAVCLMKDQKYGAEYILAFAPSHPYLEARLYLHPAAKRVFDDIGCEFEGDVQSFVNVEGQRGYYKVSPHSVRILTYSNMVRADEDDDPVELYPDHNGKDVDYQFWRRKYGECCICMTDIEPTQLEEGARFTKNGEILCKDCVEDNELTKYVELI